MNNNDEIALITFTLNVGSEMSLFVLLSSDGTINRMGNGSVDDIERQMFIDRIKPDVFHRIRSRITPGVFYWLGKVLVAPEPKGKLCELVLRFKYADGREAQNTWRYGSESQGPHPEVCAFVTAALEATEPWYQQWMRRVQGKKR